jgi:hypothetical protein
VYTDITVKWHCRYHVRQKQLGRIFIDFDNDGDLTSLQQTACRRAYSAVSALLENNGKGQFRNTGGPWPLFFNQTIGQGLALSDFDNDGDEDVIISHLDLSGIPVLLRNDGGNLNHWLGITLRGKEGPASAIAARVTVTSGGKKQVFVNQWTTSYLSNNEPRIHIGLGSLKQVDLLEINWSDGKKEFYKNSLGTDILLFCRVRALFQSRFL